MPTKKNKKAESSPQKAVVTSAKKSVKKGAEKKSLVGKQSVKPSFIRKKTAVKKASSRSMWSELPAHETIAITGASGHVGNVLVRKLLRRGNISLRLLVHEHQQDWDDKDIVKIHGDVRDINSLRILCRGCKTIYHCAAHISIVSYDKKKLYAVNVGGTRNLIKIAKENNARLVYISSVEAIGKQHDGPHTERDGFDPDRTVIEYGKSKSLATLEIMREVRENGLDAVIVCPAGVVGPFDFGTSKIGKMVRGILREKLPMGVKSGGFCFVDVRDVVDVVIAACEQGKAGSHYIISGEYIEQRDIMRIVADFANVRLPRFYIPLWTLKCIAVFVELWSKITGTEPIFSSGSARVLESKLSVESVRVEQELGIRPRPLAESFADQVRWYRGEVVEL